MSKLMSDHLAIVATIDPDAYASGTQLSDAIDMSVHNRIMVILQAGVIPSSGTYNLKLTESATSGGTYTQISGKGITALTAAGTDSDKQAIVNLEADELGDGMRYVKVSLRMTGNASANDAGVLVLADESRFSTAVTTAAYGDLASVDEIVA